MGVDTSSIEVRRRFITALAIPFGRPLETDPVFCRKATFLACSGVFTFLVHFALPLQFPRQQPVLMLQSSQHFHTGGAPIKSATLQDYPWSPRWELQGYPWSPRWDVTQMAEIIFDYLVEECLNFKMYCNEVLQQQFKKKYHAQESEEAGLSEPPAKRQKVKKIVPSAVSMMIRAEKCKWLHWPGVSEEKKVDMNNRLARCQNRIICAPRVMEWAVLTELGIMDQIEDMFRARITAEEAEFETRAWKQVLSLRQKVYREMCLELFCSLKVDQEWTSAEVVTREVIHFRLGGVQHHCTLPQFGVYTGIFTPKEIEAPGFAEYMIRGEVDADVTDGFEADGYWRELTGLEGRFSETQSEVAAIRDPILRVVHKLLVYSLFHRSTHHDKIYLQELWALWLFQQRDEGRYMNLPWVLACHLEICGAGNRPDAQICGGHFVTQVMKSLGLFTPVAVSECSAPLRMQVVDMTDLRASRLIDRSTGRLIGVREVQPPPGEPVQVPRPRIDLHSIAATLRQVQATQQVILSQNAAILYAHQRYQPLLERLAQEDARAAGVELAADARPEVLVPGDGPRDAVQGDVAEPTAVQEVGADDDDESGEEEAANVGLAHLVEALAFLSRK